MAIMPYDHNMKTKRDWKNGQKKEKHVGKTDKMMSLFKLFASDVGLLASMYANGLQIQILQGEKDINFGAIYENAVAQELKAHGFDLYYFQSKKQGELDFVIEQNGNIIPIEVKSGKHMRDIGRWIRSLFVGNTEYRRRSYFAMKMFR